MDDGDVHEVEPLTLDITAVRLFVLIAAVEVVGNEVVAWSGGCKGEIDDGGDEQELEFILYWFRGDLKTKVGC